MPVTAARILDEAAQALQAAGITSFLSEAEWLLESFLNTNRTGLYLHRERVLDSDVCTRVREAVARRCSGEPLQHIIGEVPFAGCRLAVKKGVFIPRPETEELAMEMVRRLTDTRGPAADLCTGSGALGVALAYHCPSLVVTGIDISPAAVQAAEENARLNGVAERFTAVRADCRKFVPVSPLTALVSNPPYIPSGDIPGLQREVQDYDPHAALDGGKDGLDFYRDLADRAFQYLGPYGQLGLEIGHGQAGDVKNILEKNSGFTDIESRNDINGLERMVFARRKA